MDDLFRAAYRSAVNLAEAGRPVDADHLATARAWLEAHPDPLAPAPKPGPCSERCRPGSPCMVSPDGFCEAKEAA
jgi:hypothetical protein